MIVEIPNGLGIIIYNIMKTYNQYIKESSSLSEIRESEFYVLMFEKSQAIPSGLIEDYKATIFNRAGIYNDCAGLQMSRQPALWIKQRMLNNISGGQAQNNCTHI